MSTSTKDLKLKPQMVRFYEEAARSVFNRPIKVAAKDWDKFYKFEKWLAKDGILPRDYALRLTEYLKGWARSKGWGHLPVNVFMGKWAVNLYKKEIGNRHFSFIQEDAETHLELVADEYKVVMYAHQTGLSMKMAAKQLWPLMGEAWREAYIQRSRKPITEEAQKLYQGVMYGHVSATT